MPLSDTTCSDLCRSLASLATPRELGHFHAVIIQNCREVTVLPNTSVILPAGTTHTMCSGRGQEPHYIMLYIKGMKIVPLHCKKGLFTPKK